MRERLIGGLTVSTLVLVTLEMATILILSAMSRIMEQDVRHTRPENRKLARELCLTDLGFSTGTGYTRHPSQADFFAAHDTHPSAIEHFPAGSVMFPPRPNSTPRPEAARDNEQ